MPGCQIVRCQIDLQSITSKGVHSYAQLVFYIKTFKNGIVYDHDEQLLTELLCTAETSELKWSTGVPINHSLPAKLLLQKTGARIVVRDKPLRQPFSGKRLNQTSPSAKLNNQITNIAIGTRDPRVEYSKLIECFCSINNLCSNFEVKFHHQQTILANPCMNFNKSMSYIQICMAVKSDIGFHFCKCTSEEGVIVLHSSKQ